MASTNKTAHLDLSQFEPGDVPQWQADYNADMENIDTAVAANAAAIAQMSTACEATAVVDPATGLMTITSLQPKTGVQYDVSFEMPAGYSPVASEQQLKPIIIDGDEAWLYTWDDRYECFDIPAGVRVTLRREGGKVRVLAPVKGGSTGSLSVFVATTGNDETGNGTKASPFKTITKAIEMIPKTYLSRAVSSIRVTPGTYNEDVVLTGFNGNGLVQILRPSGVTTGQITVKSVRIENNGAAMHIYNLTATGFMSQKAAFYAVRSNYTYFKECVTTATDKTASGFYVGGYSANAAFIADCTSTNKYAGFCCSLQGRLEISGGTATGNTYTYDVAYAGILQLRSAPIAGATYMTCHGGILVKDSGVILGS